LHILQLLGLVYAAMNLEPSPLAPETTLGSQHIHVNRGTVVLDDCWSDGRDVDGFLKVDMEKFPSGMSSVADEIHGQGLLYGMYSSAGEMTCARYGELNILFFMNMTGDYL
jgi:hypothetical protein